MNTPISKEPVKEFSGRIIGFLETDAQGNQRLKDFSGRILGTYDKNQDCTKEFSGRIITRGNTLLALLFSKK